MNFYETQKMLAVVSALCMMCAVVPLTQNSFPENTVLSANAVETVTEGMLTFHEYDNLAYATVADCNQLAIDVEIPSEIDGLPVTIIDNYAFSTCTSLVSVTIPDSVTEIKNSAFTGCTSLESIKIPNSVTKIGQRAFSNCSKLSSITLPNHVEKFESYTFSGCSGLTAISIPDSVTKIENDVFRNCSRLTSVTFSENLESLGEYVFADCTNLKSIVFPKSVAHIGCDTLGGCSNLKSVYILNPYCTIYERYATLGGKSSTGSNTNITVYGEENSTAKAYAEKYGYTFYLLGTEPEPATESETNNDIAYMNENQIMIDFNNDKEINAKDAALLLVYAAEKGAGNVKSLEEFCLKNNLK